MSAGGGLSAAVALMARDRSGPRLAGQLLGCPMLDDRNETVSSRQYDGFGAWDRNNNDTAWTAIAGAGRFRDDLSPYVAPARAQDLSGLAPAFIEVGAAETFRDEAVDYALRIWATGGQAELHVWAGGYHGFTGFSPDADVSRAANAARESWLRRVLRLGG
jgi:acetyl esterase/lipase